AGNYVGLDAAGVLARGNAGSGILLEKSHRNLIGHSDPVTGVTYYPAPEVNMIPVSGWQGIRGGDTSGQYLFAGTLNADALLFEGTIAGTGTGYTFQYPGDYKTSAYGPDNLGSGNVRLVGSYKNSNYATADVEVNGFLYEGTTSDFGTAGNYTTIDYPD